MIESDRAAFALQSLVQIGCHDNDVSFGTCTSDVSVDAVEQHRSMCSETMQSRSLLSRFYFRF